MIKIRVINPNIIEKGTPLYVDFVDEQLLRIYQQKTYSTNPSDFVNKMYDHNFSDVHEGRIIPIDMDRIDELEGLDTFNAQQTSIIENSVYQGTYVENRAFSIPFKMDTHQQTLLNSSERELDRCLFHANNLPFVIEVFRTNVVDGIETKRYTIKQLVMDGVRTRDTIKFVALDPRIYADTGGEKTVITKNTQVEAGWLPTDFEKTLGWYTPMSFSTQGVATGQVGYFFMSNQDVLTEINRRMPQNIYFKRIVYTNCGDFKFFPELIIKFNETGTFIEIDNMIINTDFQADDILYIDMNKRIFMLNGVSIIKDVEADVINSFVFSESGETRSYDIDTDASVTIKYTHECPVLSISNEGGRILC